MIRALLAALVCSVPLLAAAQPTSDPSAVALRPIDRATVRIVSVRGLAISAGPGRRTSLTRVAANPETSHGSGVAIADRLVLTARHVVWGAEAWVVFAPNSSTPIAARPVYIDPDHDLAFLYLDRAVPDHIALPADRRLTLSERVSVSGYPLDLREPVPAASSGEVSRVTRSGDLHLTMSVNPGNSGGPVIDERGHLVGVLSARGRPESGVEGLAIAVTLGNVRAAFARVPSERPELGAPERELASAIALLTGMEDRTLVDERERVRAIASGALGWTSRDADRDIIVAGVAWNTLIELLEARDARTIESLPEADRELALTLHRSAQQLAARALEHGPHIRRRFPIARAITLGYVEASTPRLGPFR